jgi:hypothetical protein
MGRVMSARSFKILHESFHRGNFSYEGKQGEQA